ncbi:RDD family protein [Maribacter sp. PR1]|uniref:RDD family protein n=1 Tax=Maribacter cobaltidurans TaxID=1178778 RepID=A0ABU7IWN4_9FLAO|nr:MULTISPECIES: RDD family protein [Maribacter]MDC6389999.1 RDD family protein [Maribacter sp. PR1]MEE1977389.1 RDD family protein [Maribacter cobaltidurans]
MEQFQIETAQNISIAQNTAHLGDRMLAYIIDSLIIVIYYVLMIWVLLALDVDPGDQWAIYMLLSLPAFLYYLLLETFMDGKTIGKSFLKIRVVKLDGTKPVFSSYFIRWILRILDIMLSSGGVAVFTILIRGKGQRVGDIAAGTTVISEKRKVFLKDTLLRDVPENYTPKFPQVTVFKDSEMQTIKNLFDNAKRNGNHRVILSLNNRIKKVTDITSDLQPMEFVDIVIKDYSYYTQQY